MQFIGVKRDRAVAELALQESVVEARLEIETGPQISLCAATFARDDRHRFFGVLGDLDKLVEGANTSRACVVHARTLEVLEELGVTERLRAEGHVVPRFTIRDRDRVLATVRFDRLPTRYPYTLMIPQNVTEAILLQHLREMGGDERGPVSPAAQVEEIGWGSRFHVHHWVAERYRAGRVLIAGDAAHVHSPAGGQGMNTGIQDAIVLGHALVEVIRARASEDSFSQYERSRRPVAEHVVALTDRMTRTATMHGRRARSVRNAAIRLIGSIPAVRRRMAFELAELRYH